MLGARWDVLDRVRHLHLRARQLVEGVYQGTRRSVRIGHDVEFADYKPYTAGDSLRDLDWRVLARSDRLVVRRYRAEAELCCTIVLDVSADLGSTPRKFEQAVTLAATLAVFCSLDGEPVGLVLGAGEGVALRTLRPGSGRRHLAQLLTMLASVQPAGRAGLDRLFHDVAGQLGSRGLVAVVGDFAEEPSGWIGSLNALAQRRADLRAFQVYDPVEAGLQYPQPLRVYSLEADGRRPIDPLALRPAFEAEVERFFAEVRGAFLSRRGQHQLVPADADLVPVLSRFARGEGDPLGRVA